MTLQTVEIFTAGCSLCDDVVQRVRALASPSCRIVVVDMKDEAVSEKARRYGVRRVPAVVVNGQLAGCCRNEGIDSDTLRALIGDPA